MKATARNIDRSASSDVAARAYSGETLTHTVRLADDSLMRATQSLRDGLGAEQIEIGAHVTLSWQPDACIVLPA